MTQLTRNFSLEELTHSNTATARHINNTPDATCTAHLRTLAEALQSLRDQYGSGIVVNVAYRSPALNRAIGGATTSQHMTGYAADLHPADGNMSAFKTAVLEWAKTHQYDQIIFEQCDKNGIPSWIHLGIRHVTKGQRRQQLIAKKISGTWHYSIYK